ncbi:MAG TPA: class I SAM-dependent methyltransferase [Burkholderiales bacterium]|nr:class I SAM-dependent methyltransferase [Burkholderiales bacterium]
MSDLSRVREVYERRDAASGSGRYSPFRPGELYMLQRREEATLAILRGAGCAPLAGLRVLEIGCGRGRRLADFMRWDARAADLFGVDIMPGFLADARSDYPALGLCLASGAALPFPNASFDIVMQSMVFTSILDMEVRRRMAAEMMRVTKRGGALLWYDFRYPSPRNPEVRPVGRRELNALFPGFEFRVRSVTLLPPLARLIARFSFGACRALEAIPALRSHYLALGNVPGAAAP